mgnify:CR=1 FL=1
MKKIIGIGLIVLFILSCKNYVQVYGTGVVNLNVENDYYVYENDSLKITYTFWNEKGLMTFAIFNKLNKPLYIDWKKSSYIDNSVKLNYWVDEVSTKSTDYYQGYYYKGPLLKPGYVISNSVGVSVSSTVKVERITFLPPKSNYYRSQFYILPNNHFLLDKNTQYKEVPRSDNPNKKTKIPINALMLREIIIVIRNVFLKLKFCSIKLLINC